MKKPVDTPADRRRRDVLNVFKMAAADPVLDGLCAAAGALCEAPVAGVTLADGEALRYVSRRGIPVDHIPLVESFCARVLSAREIIVVPDLTKDDRFSSYASVRAEGGYRFYVGAPLILASGEVIGTVCVMDHHARPLSDEKQRGLRSLAHAVVNEIERRVLIRGAQDRARFVNEVLRQQIADQKAHDVFVEQSWRGLRVPLTQHLEHLSALGTAAAGTSAAAELARAIERGREVLAEMDAIARRALTAGDERGRHVDFDVAALLTAVVGSFGPAARDKGLKIDLRTEMDDVFVSGDADRIEQIVANLVANAVAYTARGVVMVNARRDHGDVVMVVSDTGVGMTPAVQSAMLTGTGLGVKATVELVEALGGAITWTSSPGVGTTVTVRLPLAVSVCAIATPVPGLRVLVVDDVTINQKVTRAILAPHRADVRVASSGEEALAIFETESFDLVLMDRYMPGIDGLETTRRMREIEAARGTRTVIFGTSAANEAGDGQHFLAAGADDTVAKPMRLEEFWVKINRNDVPSKKRVA